jgi:hypothetical protein
MDADAQTCRAEKRSNSGIGIVVVPIHNGSPDILMSFSAIAKDVSTSGIGVIASSAVTTSEVVACLSDKQKVRMFRGAVHHRKELGSGWIRFGVKVAEELDKVSHPQLARFVASIMR